jgi:hypothetical protein
MAAILKMASAYYTNYLEPIKRDIRCIPPGLAMYMHPVDNLSFTENYIFRRVNYFFQCIFPGYISGVYFWGILPVYNSGVYFRGIFRGIIPWYTSRV